MLPLKGPQPRKQQQPHEFQQKGMRSPALGESSTGETHLEVWVPQDKKDTDIPDQV